MTAPAYQRIADGIRRKLANGELAPGDRLPTAAELATQWNVSGAVVTQALGTLKAEGLLESQPARGTFVRTPQQPLTWTLGESESRREDTSTADAWALAIQKHGWEPSSSVTVRRIKASPAIASWLQLAEDDTIIVRERLRYADDRPCMITVSYFSARVAAGTRLEEPGDQPAPGGLLAEAGHPQRRMTDTVSAPIGSTEETRALQLPDSSRVWCVLRIGYGADDQPVHAMHTVAPLELWQLEFAHTVSSPGIGSPFLSRDYPGVPYPGDRPDTDFVELDGAGWVLRSASDVPSGWAVDLGDSYTVDLNSWLTRQGTVSLDERLPILAYGSNASPGKIDWLRNHLDLAGPVVVLQAEVEGVAAVWTGGYRGHDGERPAVLAAAPGTESHAIWLATPGQRAVLDRCEGRGERYRLAWVHAPVTLTDGTRYEWVLAYLARPEVMGQAVEQHLNRSPLLIDGELVRVAEVNQAEAKNLTGELADTDGLEAIEVTGSPSVRDIDVG